MQRIHVNSKHVSKPTGQHSDFPYYDEKEECVVFTGKSLLGDLTTLPHIESHQSKLAGRSCASPVFAPGRNPLQECLQPAGNILNSIFWKHLPRQLDRSGKLTDQTQENAPVTHNDHTLPGNIIIMSSSHGRSLCVCWRRLERKPPSRGEGKDALPDF